MSIFSLVLTVVVGAWLAVLVALPRRWSAFVDWEYNLWARTALKNVLGSDRMRAFEKGIGLKLLVAATFAYLLTLTIVLFWLD